METAWAIIEMWAVTVCFFTGQSSAGSGKITVMKTVKEVSKLTGISVRTLHYYDEIGLLKPTRKSEAGYRLYDDKAMETLQQILFFREFDIPLKEIKAVMENPSLDRSRILQMQRKMLVIKKKRIERLIASIDDILRGDDQEMDYEVFNRAEIEEMYCSIEANMSEEQKAVFIDHYGSMEKWKENFLKNASTEEAQRNFQKVAEWYGGKDKALEASRNPGNSELFPAYQRRMERIIEKLAGKKGQDVNSFEIRELIGEYDFVSKQLYQMEDVTKLMLELAEDYQKNGMLRKVLDSVHGEGTTEYIGRAIEAFYRR